MFRHINPTSQQELRLRMLFQPADDGVFYRACEADGYRGLVAAILENSNYEMAPAIQRLVQRLRIANDVALLAELESDRRVRVAEDDAPHTLNVASDERFIRSLHGLGFVSLEPALAEPEGLRG